jgi:hypothetical protein
MSRESDALGKTIGNLGRVVQKGKELAQEERRPVTPPPEAPKEIPIRPAPPAPTSQPG